MLLDHELIYDAAVVAILNTYSTFSYKPQHSQWTILASFFLTRRHSTFTEADDLKIISLATGTKCLPTARFSPRGETIHDCHAEVLARRSALRWFLEEIARIHSSSDDTNPFKSTWIELGANGKYTLQEGVHLNLYVSTLPCGDASMGYLAATQDEVMAAMKNASVFPELDPTAASRGRDDYARLGVLRTKPGRADSPPTACMSCSDKIARWNVLGIQGALGSALLSPLYIEAVVVGEVPLELREVSREDCERAFWKRLGVIQDLPVGFSVRHPNVYFTDHPFPHSRAVLGSASSCNGSICWSSDSKHLEILINGLKRGVSPKHRYREKSRPCLSRISFFNLYKDVLALVNPDTTKRIDIYLREKEASTEYQSAKQQLLSEHGPFRGWIFSGNQWQQFDINGEATL
ncbi:tRNA-specific adenosine deaminase TAD1 [Psilocybe cubensis]|uniref:A to I editase domain-containing protein n=2 Tax=Psilocybe cubensis TaxID=181762 RepID=A0A8H7Y1V4_PSICU|nr:tRNA-specific adenosine deaminase TAD1 [Psilocybe cubensis]KAH9482889.1 tRNA-specific adenosine deaminase TAD1 [Psilocybe cubensis]